MQNFITKIWYNILYKTPIAIIKSYVIILYINKLYKVKKDIIKYRRGYVGEKRKTTITVIFQKNSNVYNEDNRFSGRGSCRRLIINYRFARCALRERDEV